MTETNVPRIEDTATTPANSVDTLEKERNAKRVYVARDPRTLSAEDGRIWAPFVSEIPLITEYGSKRLSRQLSNVKKGRSAALTTPLLREGESLKDIAQAALSICEQELKDYPELLEVERENAKKCSPTSVMYPYDKRKKQLDQYFVDPGGDVSDDELRWGADLIKRYIGVQEGRLRPLSLEEAAARLPADTQWGLPYVVHGIERMSEEEEIQLAARMNADVRNVIGFWDYRNAYSELAQEMSKDFFHEGWRDPCMLGWRGDLGKPTPEDPIGTKQRIVWMYPHAVSILESTIYPVLTQYLRDKPGFAAWRPETDTREKIHHFLTSLEDGRLVWAFDASGFDFHLPEKLIDAVSRYIVQPLFQQGTRPLIEQLSSFSKTCGMVTPEGVKTGRRFNRPSGSGGTNLLDCLENLLMFAIVAKRCGYDDEFILKSFKEVMGDDAVYEVLADWAEKMPANHYQQAFGAVVNTDKENLSNLFTTYLKRLYTETLEGAASFERIVLKASTYERPTPRGWSMYMTENRWIDQLGQLSTSPLFYRAIDFFIERAPLKLGLSLQGGVDELLEKADQYAWKESAKTADQVLNVEDKTLDAELGIPRSPGRQQVIDYLRTKGSSVAVL